MKEREDEGSATGDAGRRISLSYRLKPGQVYFDLDNPEKGPFVATGDESVDPGAHIVAQAETDKESWERLVAEGWGEFKPGAGDRAYDQGAFGQEDDPRARVLNAAPPAVGEGLTPIESEEEERRR